jgi:glycosyltransferase involved in cell wall biosynthesis
LESGISTSCEENSSCVFTISNSSRNDIIKIYGINPEIVHSTYLGIKKQAENIRNYNMDDLRKKFGIDGKYILFVGTLQPRKNISRLIEAFSKLKKDNLSLVIVGKKGWQYTEILSAPDKYHVRDNVKFLDFVSDEDLPSLYKNAFCFVLPSLYEGFGLPVLEAMKYGCPVLTSNVSSLPEAGGDAALYFDPNSAEEIALAINKLIKDAIRQLKKPNVAMKNYPKNIYGKK